jgi:hypothetical protein
MNNFEYPENLTDKQLRMFCADIACKSQSAEPIELACRLINLISKKPTSIDKETGEEFY